MFNNILMSSSKIYQQSPDLKLIRYFHDDEFVKGLFKKIVNESDVDNIQRIELYEDADLKNLNVDDFKCYGRKDNREVMDKLDVFDYKREKLRFVESLQLIEEDDVFESYDYKYDLNV